MFSKADQKELSQIKKNDGTGGIALSDVQYGLSHMFEEEKNVYVPSIQDLSRNISLSALKENKFSSVVFSMAVNDEHQVMAWIDLKNSPAQVIIIDSLGNKVTNDEIIKFLHEHISDELNIIIDDSPYDIQMDKWSCGVFVLAHAEYMRSHYLKINPENQFYKNFDSEKALERFYFSHIIPGRKQHNVLQEEQDSESNDRAKRNILYALETQKTENHVNNIDSNDKKYFSHSLYEFLQIELWGNLYNPSPENSTSSKTRSNDSIDLLRLRSTNISAMEYYRLQQDPLGALLLYSAAQKYHPLLMENLLEQPMMDNFPLTIEEQEILDIVIKNINHSLIQEKNPEEFFKKFISCWDSNNYNSIIEKILSLFNINQNEFKIEGEISSLPTHILNRFIPFFEKFLQSNYLPVGYIHTEKDYKERIDILQKKFPKADHAILSYFAVNKKCCEQMFDNIIGASIGTALRSFPSEIQNEFFLKFLSDPDILSSSNNNYFRFSEFISLEYRKAFCQEIRSAYSQFNYSTPQNEYIKLICMSENDRTNYIIKHIIYVDQNNITEILRIIPEQDRMKIAIEASNNIVKFTFLSTLNKIAELLPVDKRMDYFLSQIEKINFNDISMLDGKDILKYPLPGEHPHMDLFEIYLSKGEDLSSNHNVSISDLLESIQPKSLRLEFYENCISVQRTKNDYPPIRMSTILETFLKEDAIKFYKNHILNCMNEHIKQDDLKCIKFLVNDEKLQLEIAENIFDIKNFFNITAELPDSLKKTFVLNHIDSLTDNAMFCRLLILLPPSDAIELMKKFENFTIDNLYHLYKIMDNQPVKPRLDFAWKFRSLVINKLNEKSELESMGNVFELLPYEDFIRFIDACIPEIINDNARNFVINQLTERYPNNINKKMTEAWHAGCSFLENPEEKLQSPQLNGIFAYKNKPMTVENQQQLNINKRD